MVRKKLFGLSRGSGSDPVVDQGGGESLKEDSSSDWGRGCIDKKIKKKLSKIKIGRCVQ